MALIPNLSDIPELTPVAPGEYDLIITRGVESKSKRSGRPCILLFCCIEGEDNAEELCHNLWLPDASIDEAAKMTKRWREIKKFLSDLGLDTTDEIDVTDFDDVRFSALLDLEDNEYGRKNVIKKIT